MSDVQTLIASVRQAREAVLNAVAGLSSAQADYHPSLEEWSITQNIEHLFLAEVSGMTKIWAALDRFRGGERWVGELPNHGRSIEDVVAATWKPKEAAPDICVPRIGGALGAWASALRSLQQVLDQLGSKLDGLDLHAIVFPHFLSGPLDARQRLEFLRFHLERHLAQIERVKASPGFPKSQNMVSV